MNSKFFIITAIIYAFISPIIVEALPQRKPPQEAFNACSYQKEGSSCSFSTPRGTISGTCKNMRKGLICVPSNHHKKQQQSQSYKSDNNYYKDNLKTSKQAQISAISTVVDTGEQSCYNNYGKINCPKKGEAFYGQDAQYKSKTPTYRNNSNGTVTDINTGLIWSKAVNDKKVSLNEANKIAKQMTLGRYTDWRVPTIKELYSLIDFKGYTGFAGKSKSTIPSNAVPFIDTKYFDFEFGKIDEGERYMDAQWLSNTKYVSTTMNGDKTLFGVNFADGRIKGYGYQRRSGKTKKFYARYVRGPKTYGINKYVDNGDNTITDKSSGLMWMKTDSGNGMNWQKALKYSEDLNYAGYSDWRLPNAKELQYIVDYSKSPDTNNSPAIDSIFQTTSIQNEAKQKDYPYFWTSTTHLDGPNPGKSAAYVSFGRAIGQMHGRIMDVHGAGAQRSDPKSGNAKLGHGPQGDAVRVKNFVRCVRNTH